METARGTSIAFFMSILNKVQTKPSDLKIKMLLSQGKINLASQITCIKEPKKQPVLEMMNLAINLLNWLVNMAAMESQVYISNNDYQM